MRENDRRVIKIKYLMRENSWLEERQRQSHQTQCHRSVTRAPP